LNFIVLDESQKKNIPIQNKILLNHHLLISPTNIFILFTDAKVLQPLPQTTPLNHPQIDLNSTQTNGINTGKWIVVLTNPNSFLSDSSDGNFSSLYQIPYFPG